MNQILRNSRRTSLETAGEAGGIVVRTQTGERRLAASRCFFFVDAIFQPLKRLSDCV